jgi:hypothetical protein
MNPITRPTDLRSPRQRRLREFRLRVFLRHGLRSIPHGSGVGGSVLLRQPHGFEGLRFLIDEVGLDSGREPSLVEGQNHPTEGIDLNPASRSFDAGACPSQNLVSDDANIQGFDHLGLEGVWFHPCANPRSTFEGLAVSRDQLNLRVDVLQGGVEIAATEGVQCAPHPRHDLRISVSHRPRSIPQAQESA